MEYYNFKNNWINKPINFHIYSFTNQNKINFKITYNKCQTWDKIKSMPNGLESEHPGKSLLLPQYMEKSTLFSGSFFGYSGTDFIKLLASLIFILAILLRFTVWTGISKSLKVENFSTNDVFIKAQMQSKKAKKRGENPMSSLDEFIMNSPDIKPDMGYRIKTPNGNYAYYFMSERGEPFLMDNAGNIWIWEGIHSNKPEDNWIVRTPEGEIYSYFLDTTGQLSQNLIGHEKSIKAISDTNLGTILGFPNEDINDLHFQELPSSSLRSYKNTKNGNFSRVPPPLIEEGQIEFQKNNSSSTDIFSRNKNSSIGYDEVENSIRYRDEEFKTKFDPFLKAVQIDDNDVIDALQNRGFINDEEANELRSKLLYEIIGEAKTSLEGKSVSDLPSAMDFANAGNKIASTGIKSDNLGYFPGDLLSLK